MLFRHIVSFACDTITNQIPPFNVSCHLIYWIIRRNKVGTAVAIVLLPLHAFATKRSKWELSPRQLAWEILIKLLNRVGLRWWVFRISRPGRRQVSSMKPNHNQWPHGFFHAGLNGWCEPWQMQSLDAPGCSNAIVATLCFFIMDRRICAGSRH